MSMEDTINSSTYIISVSTGYFSVITGLIGHIINILVFTQLKLFRKNQSAFYLTVASIVDCWQLFFSTTTRVTATAFSYDLTRTSRVWCKMRAYLTISGAVVLTYIISFSAIDQYLSTSYYVRVRQLSTYKLAQRASGVLIVVALLYDTPFLIFQDINRNCATYDAAFNFFYSFVHFCLIIGLVPILISSIFSFLAYQNVRRIVRRHMPIVRRRLDHQLTALVLVRVALFVITTVPFICFRIYQLNSPVDQNNALAVAIDQLIRTCFNTVNMFNNSGAFYIFWISSPRFRRQVRHVLFKKNWRKCLSIRMKRNQVAPGNQPPAVESPKPSVEVD